jgi:hypothetical protein
MRLATSSAPVWPVPELRSRIVLYAWYPPDQEGEGNLLTAGPDGCLRDRDCTKSAKEGRSRGG